MTRPRAPKNAVFPRSRASAEPEPGSLQLTASPSALRLSAPSVDAVGVRGSRSDAGVAARAASNVQAKHVLVLTNARYQRAKLFESTLATLTGGTIGATVRLCTNAPPDAEKEVCSRAAALLLTRESSFSTQVHRMAMAANGGQYDEKGHDERHEYLSYCPKKDAWLWQKERLLRGVPIPCS